jgi:hypothetical protein
VLVLLPALGWSQDALEIVQNAFKADEENAPIARTYTFHERVEHKIYRKGKVRDSGSKTWDVTLLDGEEYRRLIAKDDQPLNPDREKKEAKKLRKSIEKMRNETAAQREKRRRRIEKEQAEERRFIHEITVAFDFTLAGEETVDGVGCYVVLAEPRPGYEPPFGQAKVLRKIRGKLWIAKEDYGWVKAEVDTIDSFTFGLFLFKLRKGAEIRFRQRRVNDEVWLPAEWDVRAAGRAALVAKIDAEINGTYDNFRKFSADSSVTFGETLE